MQARAGSQFPRRSTRLLGVFLLVFLARSLPAEASSLKISTGSAQRLPAEVEADYSTSHTYVDEVAATQIPITVFFDPQTAGVESAEVFTNLNRRAFATHLTSTGVEEGINPPPGNSIAANDDTHY